jgi:hypothetical protein
VHPDKDHGTPVAIATARFQRVKAAYELLSDATRRRTFDASVVISKPCCSGSGLQRAASKAKKRPRAKAAPQGAAGDATSSTKFSTKSSEAEAPSRRQSTVEVLDSDEEEAAREEKEQAAEALRFAQKRVRMRRTAEQAERIRQREAESGNLHRKHSPSTLGYLRLSLRRSSKVGQVADISADSLETAFKQFGARVVMLQSDVAVLAVQSESSAITCALSFHNWMQRLVSEAEKDTFKAIRLVVAPVAASGKALAGVQETIVVSRSQVAACDRQGSKFA